MRVSLLAVLIVGMLGCFNNAFAYLDPGTGSYLVQILIAGLVGAAFSVKIFWQRIKDFFSGKKPDSDEDEGKKPDKDEDE
ncbi:hypothetical protein HQ587_08560 [bacterium]|nr:hypothetical protein [bacterium]